MKDAVIQELLIKNNQLEKHVKVLNSLKEQYDKQILSLNGKIKKLECVISSQSSQIQD